MSFLEPRRPDPAMLRRLKEVEKLPDEEIIALMWGASGIDLQVLPMEMTRRQIVASRDLETAIKNFDKGAQRASRWLIVLTVAIVVLTVVLIGLEVIRWLTGR